MTNGDLLFKFPAGFRLLALSQQLLLARNFLFCGFYHYLFVAYNIHFGALNNVFRVLFKCCSLKLAKFGPNFVVLLL
jgi:hypothetical protein